MRSLLFIAVACASLNVAQADSTSSVNVTIERTDDGFLFRSNDRPVLFYQSKPITKHNHTRAGFVHPLYGLDGEVLTDSFPADHRHHQGVFWAWHQLWASDQKNGARKVGDPWITKDHLVVVKKASILAQEVTFATLDIEAEWTSTALDDSGEAKSIVAERTQITVHRQTGDSQLVDFTIKLTPLVPNVRIGGSENVKGYSGFTVRVKPPKDMKIQTASGVLDGDGVQIESRWAGVSGSFSEGKTSGVTILTKPTSSEASSLWVLRHYGMQNAAYPGREPVTLSAEDPLVLQYRLVIHRGSTNDVDIDKYQSIYDALP